MTLEEMEAWAKRSQAWADRMEERHATLAQSLEILSRDIHALQQGLADLRAMVEASTLNINALARIAEIHERRITGLEGGH